MPSRSSGLNSALVMPRREPGAHGLPAEQPVGVELNGDFAVLRVDTEAAGDRPGGLLDLVFEPLPLGERIKDDMVTDRQQLLDVGVAVSRSVGMHLAAEFFKGQTGLVRCTRRGAAEVLAHQRERAPCGKALECQEDLAASPLLHGGKELQVGFKGRHVDHPARGIGHQLGVDVQHAGAFDRDRWFGVGHVKALSHATAGRRLRVFRGMDLDPSAPCAGRRLFSIGR